MKKRSRESRLRSLPLVLRVGPESGGRGAAAGGGPGEGKGGGEDIGAGGTGWGRGGEITGDYLMNIYI